METIFKTKVTINQAYGTAFLTKKKNHTNVIFEDNNYKWVTYKEYRKYMQQFINQKTK